MSQINNEYYPKDKHFTEISAIFFGSKRNPRDLTCYLRLSSLSKKLGMEYPEYIVEKDFSAYGIFLRYGFRTILDETKNSNIKVICNELIKHGIKTNSIPMIEFINYGEETTIYTLNEYLQNKGIKLEDLNIEEMSENLEQVRE